MQLRLEDPFRKSVVRSAALAVMRAARSMIIIGAVALLLFALRHGGFEWSWLVRVVAMNRVLFALVFVAVCVWEYWLQRPQRFRARSRDDEGR
jgi:hypothetical protein